MRSPRRSAAPDVHRSIHATVVDLARRALGRLELSEADREEVVQRFILAAYESWPKYRPERGTPGQWLLGVLHNQLRAFLREQRRLAEGDRIMAEQIETMDTGLMFHAPEVLASLPPVQQRIVWYHAVQSFGFREIAFFEDMSKSEVERQYAAAVKTLRDEHKELALLAVMATSCPPRATAEELEWLGRPLVEKHGARLGIRDACDFFRDWVDDEPPESGVSSVSVEQSLAPPSRPRPRGKLRLLRLAGPLAGLLLIGTVADATLRGRHQEDAASLPQGAAPPGAATAAAPPAGAATAAEIAITAQMMGATSGVDSTSPKPACQPPRRPGPSRQEQSEEALFEEGRSAFVAWDFDRAAVAFAKHAQLFPGGRHAGRREQLWSRACSHGPAADCRARAVPGTRAGSKEIDTR